MEFKGVKIILACFRDEFKTIITLTALAGQLSPSVGWENGPERGFKTVSFKPEFPVI